MNAGDLSRGEHIAFRYGDKPILQDVSFALSQACVTGIIGPNGVGKSTLIRCMARLLSPQEGMIYLNGQDIRTFSGNALARQQAYVPQNAAPAFAMSVYAFVSLGRRPYVSWSLTARDEAVIRETMAYLSILDMADRNMQKLSGGEAQRVMLARALAQEPRVLILDEPTSALDIRHQLEVLTLLRRIALEKQCAVLVIMHDISLVARFADQVLLMKEGGVYALGTPADVITEANIRAIYGVHVEILSSRYGLVVVPAFPVKEESP